jgi:dGTPase
VFLFHEGDHYRTRLTHTLEVAQIARAIARQLGLDDDLAEALALAHDLGHPPFGHAGERALDHCLARHGGFDHNAQSFHVVTRLERKYAAFDGLNLTLESLEGLVKHNGPIAGAAVAPQPILHEAIRQQGLETALALDLHASAEAQAAAVADDIAYSNHDIDDGLRAGLLTLDDLDGVPLAGQFVAAAKTHAMPDRARVIYEINRRMITALIADVVAEARRQIAARRIERYEDVRSAGAAVVTFSPAMRGDLAALKSFLFERVYRHPKVMRVMDGAETIVRDLFGRYLADQTSLPAPWDGQAGSSRGDARARLAGDFVAGMTDRFAIAEHRRLFDATPELR